MESDLRDLLDASLGERTRPDRHAVLRRLILVESRFEPHVERCVVRHGLGVGDPIDVLVVGGKPVADEPRPSVGSFEHAPEVRLDGYPVEFVLLAEKCLFGPEHDAPVVAREVDDRVGGIERRLLEGGERLRCREVHRLRKRVVEPVEVRRRVTHREEQAVVRAGVRVFEPPKRPFDGPAVGIGECAVAGVIEVQQHPVARPEVVVGVVQVENVVPGVLARGEPGEVVRALREVGGVLARRTRRERRPAADSDRGLHERTSRDATVRARKHTITWGSSQKRVLVRPSNALPSPDMYDRWATLGRDRRTPTAGISRTAPERIGGYRCETQY